MVATVVVTKVTLDTFAGGLAGMSSAETEAALAPLEDLLTAIGTPALGQLRAAIDQELASHELIKVRLTGEREERQAQAAAIEERLGCALAGLVGHVAILYRPAADPAERRIDPGA